MKNAWLHELFVSIQGEGTRIGERQIFVRFQGCDLRCRYCDTPKALPTRDEGGAEFCRIQVSAGQSPEFEQVPNPVSPDQLSEFCARLVLPGPSRPTVSLTGGEPLLQAEFLEQWLPAVRTRHSFQLETNGLHENALMRVRGGIDFVSMDFKLPSATGMQPFWEEHRRFAAAAADIAVLTAKAVITSDTTKEDVLTAARILADLNRPVPFVLQPAGGRLAPGGERLVEFQDAALELVADVRVIPQAHKLLNVS